MTQASSAKIQFENDIFISYAQLDDELIPGAEEGWVSTFQKTLHAFISQYLGREPKIWRDIRLQCTGRFDHEIIKNIQASAFLLSILSPRYIVSEWCHREVQHFCEVSERYLDSLPVDSRIFKVVKYPFPPEKRQPSILENILGHEFFETHSDSGKIREYRLEFGSEYGKKYLLKVADLASQIREKLEKLDEACINSPAKHESIKTPLSTVYLAETTFELEAYRDNIRRELEARNYRVLPDYPLKYDPSFSQTAKGLIQQSCLSIHLVGRCYGIIPENEEQSVTDLQYQLARQQQQSNSSFDSLVWMPPKKEPFEARQHKFIQVLQQNLGLLQTNVEEFKNIIFDTLTKKQSFTQKNLSSAPLQVYLICDQGDADMVQPIVNYLRDSGYDVVTPLFSGSEAQVRQDHQESLALCDAVLMYYGCGDEYWQREQCRFLKRVERFEGYRTQPIQAKAIMLCHPRTPAKEQFHTLEATVIESFDSFAPHLLTPFLDQLAQLQRGTI